MVTTSIGTPDVLVESLRSTGRACPPGLGARSMPWGDRLDLAKQALQRVEPITGLAEAHGVSRKFVYEQQRRAQAAIERAFEPESVPEGFLGWLPVTRGWIDRLIVSTALDGHGSVRGICQHVDSITHRSVSEGYVCGVLSAAAARAREINDSQDLSGIHAGAHDEIFSQRIPVLTGVEPASTFIYLLEPARSRDEVAWWAALAEKHERQGLDLAISISDAARGLRAGVKAAFPNAELRGDVFHAQMEVSEMMEYLENRAYARLGHLEDEERKMARAKERGDGKGRSKRLALARERAREAVGLFDEMSVLTGWWKEQIQLIGPDLAHRQELYDWLVHEMETRAERSHRIGPVVTYLKNQRDSLLAFVVEIQRGLKQIAEEFHVSPVLVDLVYHQFALDPDDPRQDVAQCRLAEEAPEQTDAIVEAIADLLDRVLRASSAVENINSILRGYFFLRRSIGPAFLDLLRFYLNHRRFRRSERPERVGKSPRELLTGQTHTHWLELLGYPPVALQN
mgnify:CR=1 FL=1